MDDAPTVWVRPTRRFLVALVLLATGSLPGATARGLQQQRPSQPPAATFRTQVNLVEVDAVVVDSAERFVPDLDAVDFDLVEDGKRQALASVEVVNIPVARAVKTAHGLLVQDARSNTPFDGRVYLIVLDDLHISQPRTNAARALARGFIERTLAPNDLASVIVTSGTRTGIGTFTGNRKLLLEAVDRFVG